jgi:beta-galactosidase
MSHNPPAPELLDMTDAMGMIVWDEFRHFGNYSTWHVEARETLLRDRNHPSVFFWSLCNEWGCTPSYDPNLTMANALTFKSIVRHADPTRPVTGAWDWADVPDVGALTTRWANEVVDVFGMNYHAQYYQDVHAEFPNISVIGSETCWGESDRTWGPPNESAAILAQRDVWPLMSDCRNHSDNTSFLMGTFIWTGFDYRGEETPTVWPSTNSHYGMLDLCGFPKDSAGRCVLSRSPLFSCA